MLETVYMCLKWIGKSTNQFEKDFFTCTCILKLCKQKTGYNPCLHDKELSALLAYNSTTLRLTLKFIKSLEMHF